MAPATPPPLSRARHEAYLEQARVVKAVLDELLAEVDSALEAPAPERRFSSRNRALSRPDC